MLLTQSPYPQTNDPNKFFVDRGYINAVVQVRGSGDTSGPDGGNVASGSFSPRQTKDGVALVNWAAALAGSNGIVGLDGCSFLGIDQIFTAAALPANSPVKEILPACAANDYNTYFAGGIPSQIIGLFTSPFAKGLGGPKNADVNAAAAAAEEKNILAGGDKAYNRTFWQERTTTSLAAQHRGEQHPGVVVERLVPDGWPRLPGGVLDLPERLCAPTAVCPNVS